MMHNRGSKIEWMNFEDLRSSEKLDFAYFEGVFLSEREVFGYIIEIYALSNFFVEIWYGGLQDGEIPFVKIKSFKSIKSLDPYLNIESSFEMLKDINF